MRKIKFRAWDKFNKRMLYFGAFCDAMNDRERYNLLEYTGLKDKGGKRIYEGDILGRDGLTVNGSRAAVVVEWNADGSAYNGSDEWADIVRYSGFDFDIYSPEELEVIGNIYENPELVGRK